MPSPLPSDTSPGGPLTFLFTDVEGSTPLWDAAPGVMAKALERHDDLLAAVIAGHGGQVFSRAGDAFAAAFAEPTAAVEAALEAQRRLSEEVWSQQVVLRVRMGLHTGTAHQRGGDYFGPTLNRAARIASAAHGGQVLLSAATAELVRHDLSTGSSLVDLGALRLRGLAHDEHVLQLVAPGLEAAFPPPRAEDTGVVQLPRSATPMVGRALELKALGALLSAERLITLTGVGGAGKSRLALELAALVASDYPGGVWYCALAPASTPEGALSVVCAAVGARPAPSGDPIDAIVDAVAGRRALVVLDNCEHVREVAAQLAARLVAPARGATVLATSREPLDVSTERVWALPPMDLDDTVELFGERARAGNPCFDPMSEAAAVAELCARLDGLPLAVELAAARTRILTPGEIADRLHDALGILRHAHHDVDVRHHSMRATIEWSFNLLSSTERVLFARLAVFADSFDLVAAEEVCADDGLAGAEVIDVLASLVDKSMVEAEARSGTTRYRLLEALRQFAAERLAERAEGPVLAERHAAHYIGVAERARDWWEGTENARGALALAADWENLRAAFHRLVEVGDAAGIGRLLDALFHYAAFGYHHEYGEWAEVARGMPGAGPVAYAACAYWRLSSKPEETARLARRGLDISDGRSDGEAALCWFALAVAHLYSGQRDEGWEAVERYREAQQTVGSAFRDAHASGCVTVMATVTEPSMAADLARRARRLAAPLGNPVIDAWLATVEGSAAAAGGDRAAARDAYRRAVALADGGVNPLAQAQALLYLAMQAPPAERSAAYREAIERFRSVRHAADLWVVLESLASHWADSGHLEPAAVLLGHVQTHGQRMLHAERRRRRALGVIEATPGGPEWLAHGAELDPDQVVAYALRTLEETP